MARGYRHGGAGGTQDNPNIKYLYNLGDECSSVTGSWVGRAYGQYTGYDRCNPQVVNEHARLNVYQGAVLYNNYGTFGCGTSLLVDLSEYSTLHMKYALGDEVAKELTLDISSYNQPMYIGACYNYYQSGGNNWVALLISNSTSGTGAVNAINSYGYNPNSHLYIYEIWLEK